MSISAIVPVWNGRSDLERLLASLGAQTQPAAELLVVDNGSTDGAPELARERGARVIPMGRNAGFAPAVNRGIREASGEWIAVLNSDVQLAPDYFALLSAATQIDRAEPSVKHTATPEAHRRPAKGYATGSWFATGKILSLGNPSSVDGTFDLVCRGGTAWRVGSGCPDGPAFSSPRAIFSAPWTAALFRAEIFSRIGMLEERFESYLEDIDFGLRCATLGLSGRYVPEAVAWHRGSASLGQWHPETVRLMARNQLLLLARHYPRRLLFSAAWPILVAQLLWGAVALRHGRGFAWMRGKAQGLRFFSTCLENVGGSGSELLKHLREDEAAIREIQRSGASDLYWELYFFLTGAESK